MTFSFQEHLVRIETDRFGPFDLQIGCDMQTVETLLLRVNDAQQRFRNSPLSHIANHLEKEVTVSSIFGTNSIEGGALSETETQSALELDPSKIQDIEQRRALNLKQAYDLSRQAASDPEWQLDVKFIQALHAAVTDQLPHERNQPGVLRNNSKSITTYVGDQAHGGRYKPPQYDKDIIKMLEALVCWHQQLKDQQVPVLIRAPLVHLYYELVHPFWDGNGRVGRVLEATLLQVEGFQYAPFAQAHYYFENIDKYFALFNLCRKRAMKKHPFPNTAFVEFFLQGMLISLNKLHDRVNNLIKFLLFEMEIKRRYDQKQINTRQYAIVSQVLNAGLPILLSDLRQAPWYLALYEKRTDKTRQRDLIGLQELKLVKLDNQKRLWPGCFDFE
ncbi:Fic family protein [Methylobacter sp.]|uniref:Fic family protein n=1 Tax=Methylobacter sp. TaxID=2051955 RepID=UPI003DA503A5